MKFVYLLLPLILISCGKEVSVTHPIKEHLPSQASITTTVTVGSKNAEKVKPTNLSFTFSYNDSLRFFDYPKAIDHHDGLFYLLEKRKNYISVFDTSGHFQYQISRAGNGPGELIAPVTFEFSDDYSELYILDTYDTEIFQKVDDRFVPKKSVYHGLLRAYDLCVLGNSYFISGYGISKQELKALQNQDITEQELSVSGPINKYDMTTDSLISSFGFKYKSYFGSKTYGGMLSEVILSCNSSSKTVMAQHTYFPYLFGYNKNNELMWVTELKNYLAVNVLEEKGNKGYILSMYSNPTIYQRFLGFNPSSNEKNFIQFQKYIPQSAFSKKVYSENEINKIKNQTIGGILIDNKTGRSTYFETDHRLVLMKDGFNVWYNKYKKYNPYEVEKK
ncbi:MAG: 6-bladed beta-propeller [Balneolaceae bacterium]|nr:6-bladed beta-propeller [Balneolaceae bacterium]